MRSSIIVFALFMVSTVVGTTCSTPDGNGVCLSTSACASSGFSVAGYCPGSTDIQCCIATSCSTSYGAGQCLETSNGCSGGTFYSGYCPGSSSVECCVKGSGSGAGSSNQLGLHTTSRWIVDSNNTRFKLRCVNWAGHMETRIPEGLQHQPVDTIAAFVASAGFNCVRLTYSVDMALDPNQQVSASFSNAAAQTGVSASAMTALYNTAVSVNPWLSTATTQGTFGRVINALAAHNISVILDNTVSRASWCCSTTDGNGWWAEASGYNAGNSQYFNTGNWLASLQDMATFARSYPNVIGMSLRNEPRTVSGQDANYDDWYTFMDLGTSAIHNTNADLLVIVSGVNYATYLGMVYSRDLDTASFSDKHVWEFHDYQWDYAPTDCTTFNTDLGDDVGFVLVQGKPYTAPLWLSEFGWTQWNPSPAENTWRGCLVSYMENGDIDWSYWALQGDYYVRNGQIGYNETFGVYNQDWTDWRNPDFHSLLGNMWQVTQGPGV